MRPLIEHYRRFPDGLSIFFGHRRVLVLNADYYVADFKFAEPFRRLGMTHVGERWRGRQVLHFRPGDMFYGREHVFFKEWFRILKCANERLACTGYRCDIATLPVRRGRYLYQTDLMLDLFVFPNGEEYTVADIAEYHNAVRDGLISQEEAGQAAKALEKLVDIVERGRFLAFMAEICEAEMAPVHRSEGVRGETFSRWLASQEKHV